MFLTVSPFYAQERIPPVALRSVAQVTQDLWRDRFALFHEHNAFSLTKMSDLLEKPMSGFPTLVETLKNSPKKVLAKIKINQLLVLINFFHLRILKNWNRLKLRIFYTHNVL